MCERKRETRGRDKEKTKKRERERERGGWKECIRIRNKVAYLHGEIAVYILYVRSTVNYTVNRRMLFDRKGKEDRARCPTRTKDESRCDGERGWVEKAGGKIHTTAKFMEREMIYGTIVENKSHGSKDV